MSVERMHGWRKWVGIILLVFLVVSFMFFGLSYYMQSMFAGGKSLAKVAGQSISHDEFQRALQIQQRNTPSTDPSTEVYLKQRLLATMIIQRVMQNEAQQQGFRVGDSELRAAVHSALHAE